MTKVEPVPHEVVVVDEIPQCSFCDKPGPYDFKTTHGAWANGCMAHYAKFRAYPTLGEGKGQLLVTKEQLESDTRS